MLRVRKTRLSTDRTPIYPSSAICRDTRQERMITATNRSRCDPVSCAQCSNRGVDTVKHSVVTSVGHKSQPVIMFQSPVLHEEGCWIDLQQMQTTPQYQCGPSHSSKRRFPEDVDSLRVPDQSAAKASHRASSH